MGGVMPKVEQISRVNARVASAKLVLPPLDFNNKLTKIVDQWPLILVIFGGALTLVWLAVLIWLPLRLLQMV